MPRTILLATGNFHKVEEIRQILRHYPVELTDLRAFPPFASPEESGANYFENALLKARYFGQQTGLLALADDSGLEVEALDGAPGLHSARFGGASLPHSEKIQLLLEKLQSTPQQERRAQFRCCSVLYDPKSGQYWSSESTCPGSIAWEPHGEQGFGYDPIFLIEEGGRTMAQLQAEEKHRISHRGKSLRNLFDQQLAHL